MNRQLLTAWIPLFVALAGACAYETEPQAFVPTPSSGVMTAADQVHQVIETLDPIMVSALDPDLAQQWNDLSSDLRSIVDDLVHDSQSVDVAGLEGRLSAMGERLTTRQGSAVVEDSWDLLQDHLDQFFDQISSRSVQRSGFRTGRAG